MDKHKNKNRKSPRARWWDYGWDGSYFITICTRNREHFFGKVKDQELELSETGMIAERCWLEIPEHAKHIGLGPHVVMPNHVHRILNLKGNAAPFRHVPPSKELIGFDLSSASIPVNVGRIRFRNPGKNTVSTIIGGYKSAVSKQAREQGIHFNWQSRFHDHIIRDAKEYRRIAEYILNNPRNWKSDRFCSDGL